MDRNFLKFFLKKILYSFNYVVPFKSNLSEEHAREYLEKYSARPQGECFAQNSIKKIYDVQIIIPAYNAEEHIVECMESVLKQISKYRILVTVVNDGSTDRTHEILINYVRKREEFTIEVVDQDNKGHSGARNAALHVLSGEYIFFLDADDVLEKGAIEKMLDIAYMTNADILQGSWYDFVDDEIVEQHIVSKEGVLSDNRGVLSGYPWGKLYKNTVLKNFQFPEGYWFEDTPISFVLAAMPFRCVATKEIIYGYRLNPEGITSKAAYSKKSIDTYWITEQCLKEFPMYEIQYDQRAYEYLIRQSIMNYWRTRRQSKIARESVFVLTTKLVEKYFANFETTDIKMKKIEQAIRKHQFWKFEILLRFM